jgi:sialate O-acetylesterase
METIMKSAVTNMKLTFAIVTFGLFMQSSYAQDWNRIVNLKGYWKFSIGDDMNWADPSYNDDEWEEIRVPSYWEDEGFYGYNGYAWYRVHFRFPEDFKGQMVYLDLGAIDDIDEAYLNGKLVGFSGTFPPHYQTAYFAYRHYPVPVSSFKKNQDNVIAVRVFDAELGGGIPNGNIGIYYKPNSLNAELNLEGEWKFKAGDNKEWKNKNFNDKNWSKMIVPGFWESQGYKDYDGFGWYRRTFKVPDRLKGKKLVLMMGKIDDLDEVYLNGEFVGSTGTIRDNGWENTHDQEYSQFRGYYLPDGLIKYNEDNVIAVRVYDGYINGGIYEGPLGLISQERYTKFWRKNKSKKNIFEIMFE